MTIFTKRLWRTVKYKYNPGL